MNIYLAARYSRYPEMQGVAKALREMGHEVTSRWIQGGHETSKEGSTQAQQAQRVRFAQEDLADLKASDCCLCFTEEPRTTNSRGGRHVELGIALGLGLLVLVVGWRENVFCCLPQVRFFETWPEARAHLLDLRRLERTAAHGLYCNGCGSPITQDERRRPVCPIHGRFLP